VFFVNEARSLFELMTNKRSVKFFFAQTPTLLRTDDPQGRRARLAAGSRTGLGEAPPEPGLPRRSHLRRHPPNQSFALITMGTPLMSQTENATRLVGRRETIRAEFFRGHAVDEATLEAPAQAELRPTCAGAPGSTHALN
jgi:hypothetical protein